MSFRRRFVVLLQNTHPSGEEAQRGATETLSPTNDSVNVHNSVAAAQKHQPSFKNKLRESKGA